MTRTLEIPESVYEALERAAGARGVTPVGWIEHHLKQENGATKNGQREDTAKQVEDKGETMYDVLKDYIGKFSSNDPSCWSESAGAKFTDYLVQKHKEGRL